MSRKLIITWMPDVLSMVEHNGSHKIEKEVTSLQGGRTISNSKKIDSNYKGLTCRSERESFIVKSKEKAEKLLNRRNKSQIQFATYNGEVIFIQ